MLRFIRFIKAALIAATSGLSAAAPAAIPPTPPARVLSTEDIEIREDKDQGLFDYLYWRELSPEEKAESHASFEAWLAQSEDAVMQQVRPEEINRWVKQS